MAKQESEFETGALTEFERFKEWVKQDQNHSKEWRQQASEDFDFVSGTQWSEEDRSYLKLQNRPMITFNRIDPVIDSVSGLEVNNRQQINYFPRHIGDAGVDELLSGAAKWLRDECDAEDEESDSFRDMIICGMGWTETRVDYDQDPDGMMIIERVDPIEMVWDSGSTKKNLADARRIARIRDLPMSVVEDMFPDADPGDLHAAWAMDTGSAHQPHDAIQAVFYTEDQTDLIDKNRVLCRIVELQWWEHKYVWRLIDPVTKQLDTVTNEEYKILKERFELLGKITGQDLGKFPAVRQKEKHFFKVFLGDKLLERKDGPKEGGFTYKCMTGKRDRNKSLFYGLVRAMIDPQKWANKWLSQVMHIINTNAQGGIMAEEGAFSNPQEAVDEWADTAAVTLVKNGALSGGKIQPKPQTPWPSGLQGMMEFAITSIRDVSGVNLEILGQADREQSGILEHHRKQSAMTILAGMFDALRRYRKEQGRLMLYYITNYLSDGRLIKIGGNEEARYVPLVRQADTVKYDVIVDDTPNSVNLKDQAWSSVTQLMPFLSKMQVPLQVWLDILKYSPLPSSLVTDITNALLQEQQHMQSMPKQPDPKLQAAQLDLQSKQMDLQMQQSEAQDTKIRASVDMAQLQAEMANVAAEQEKIKSEAFKNRAIGLKELATVKTMKHNTALDSINAVVNAVKSLTPNNQG